MGTEIESAIFYSAFLNANCDFFFIANSGPFRPIVTFIMPHLASLSNTLISPSLIPRNFRSLPRSLRRCLSCTIGLFRSGFHVVTFFTILSFALYTFPVQPSLFLFRTPTISVSLNNFFKLFIVYSIILYQRFSLILFSQKSLVSSRLSSLTPILLTQQVWTGFCIKQFLFPLKIILT